MTDGLSAAEAVMLGQRNDGYGCNGGWGEMGFMYIFAMLMLFNGGFGGWGNNRGGNVATQEFVQNGFNFNDLQDQNRDIMSAVDQAKYDNISVAKDIQQQLQGNLFNLQSGVQSILAKQNECCCETLRAIDANTYNQAEQTQRILDAISCNRMADMQNRINQLELQSAMCGVVRYPLQTTYTSGVNPFAVNGCGCNTGCGCGNNYNI